jgi:hypothetical protein
VHRRHRDQSVGNHLVEDRLEARHVLLGVDHHDAHGQILGQAKDAGRVKNAACAEPGAAAGHRRAGEAFLA